MSMIEQMVETRASKEVRGLTKNSRCRLCKEQKETVQHLLAGCKMLASHEYLTRQNRALMMMVGAWAKGKNLLDQNVKWHQEKLKRGHVLKNSKIKRVWGFQFNLRKTTTSRGQDMILEEKQTKIK